MTYLKGIPVTLVDKVPTGTDPFGRPVQTDQEIKVDNVLVAPVSTDDITNELSISGRKIVYTLAIPKGDTHDWEGKEVRFFGQRWRVVGIPLEGLNHLIPLDWNKKVTVERYE